MQPPFLHPSGHSYASLAVARGAVPADFVRRHARAFHVLELAALQPRHTSRAARSERPPPAAHAHVTVTVCTCDMTLLDVTVILAPIFSDANCAAVIVTWCECDELPWMEYVLVAPATTSALGTVREWPWLALMAVADAPARHVAEGGVVDTLQVTVTECEWPASFVDVTVTREAERVACRERRSRIRRAVPAGASLCSSKT